MTSGTQKICVYSCFSFANLSSALILAQTTRLAHPDCFICAVIVDEPPPGLNAASFLTDFDQTIEASFLRIPRFRSWLFKHSLMEACAAVKGQALVRLLEDGHKIVVYLDPNIAVFDGFNRTVEQLDTSSIILTPHHCQPHRDPGDRNAINIDPLLEGSYNSGFLAIKNDRTGNLFARWWAQQLYRGCYDDVKTGIYIDQRYLNLVPGLFGDVYIERDPGFNVAKWNLVSRRISFDKGTIVANKSPLSFFNFSSQSGAYDLDFESYEGANNEVLEILLWYKRYQVKLRDRLKLVESWSIDKFSNGESISNAARLLYRRRFDLMTYFEDPFETHGDSFYAWLNTQDQETPPK